MTDDHDHPWGEVTHDCPTCSGSGRVYWNDSPLSDPQCVEDEPCPDCAGSGVEDDSRVAA